MLPNVVNYNYSTPSHLKRTVHAINNALQVDLFSPSEAYRSVRTRRQGMPMLVQLVSWANRLQRSTLVLLTLHNEAVQSRVCVVGGRVGPRSRPSILSKVDKYYLEALQDDQHARWLTSPEKSFRAEWTITFTLLAGGPKVSPLSPQTLSGATHAFLAALRQHHPGLETLYRDNAGFCVLSLPIITTQEAGTLAEQLRKRYMPRSNVDREDGAGLVQHRARTSDTLSLNKIPPFLALAVRAVRHLFRDLLAHPRLHLEINAVRYTDAQRYDEHHDSATGYLVGKGRDERYYAQESYRFLTGLLYLTTNQHAATVFPRVNLRVLPQAGVLVLFPNFTPTGQAYDQSVHRADPPGPRDSTKVAMNFWVYRR